MSEYQYVVFRAIDKADSERSNLAEKQALKLKTQNPTLRHLTAALRRQGFVPK